jgi:hypothetical protein
MYQGMAKRNFAMRKQAREQSMKRSKKCDGRLNAKTTTFAALLIGRNSCSECGSFVGGAVKENYTAPHDIALR